MQLAIQICLAYLALLPHFEIAVRHSPQNLKHFELVQKQDSIRDGHSTLSGIMWHLQPTTSKDERPIFKVYKPSRSPITHPYTTYWIFLPKRNSDGYALSFKLQKAMTSRSWVLKSFKKGYAVRTFAAINEVRCGEEWQIHMLPEQKQAIHFRSKNDKQFQNVEHLTALEADYVGKRSSDDRFSFYEMGRNSTEVARLQTHRHRIVMSVEIGDHEFNLMYFMAAAIAMHSADSIPETSCDPTTSTEASA
eukprot:TRINITY_DN23080_c0_g1_i1.p1 TRINITY_DN23080_c0_g1~~TRINITY_DN23080_c0_g1_i1.p1  ORF type:complete len:249 (-),score=23.00 TRINITY_DN23080_c0_g1_i1:134-880(-)